MAKRKKYPKLPNGYGSIKYLGKKRTRPYGVYPPTIEYNEDGVPQTPKALCYVDDWMKGFAVLTAYKAGTYTPGMEKDLMVVPDQDSKGLVKRIITDYSTIRKTEPEEPEKTFAQIYEEFYDYKYNREKSRKYGQQSKNSTRTAFRNCAALHDRAFKSLRHDDLQGVIDNCPLKHSSLELIVSLFHQMYAYADTRELCDKDYSAHVKINIPDDDEHGVPFTIDELKILWGYKDDPIIEFVLIMCYSGFRIAEYKDMGINLEKAVFYGGLKTEAGRERFVPIHSGIQDLVKKRIKRDGSILSYSDSNFRKLMRKKILELGFEDHTPHDCRHTFSMLCEKNHVQENDRKRMLGHKFDDVTNKVYGHRSVEDLREEIEKIEICC